MKKGECKTEKREKSATVNLSISTSANPFQPAPPPGGRSTQNSPPAHPKIQSSTYAIVPRRAGQSPSVALDRRQNFYFVVPIVLQYLRSSAFICGSIPRTLDAEKECRRAEIRMA